MTDHPAAGHGGPTATAGSAAAAGPAAAAGSAPGTAGSASANATASPAGRGTGHGTDDLYEAEVLVEEVSIDGMCGVY